MNWIESFYQRQTTWGVSDGGVQPYHRARAEQVESLLGPGPFRVLELGAGSGEVAIAMAERGHRVVAIELVEERVALGRSLISKDLTERVDLVQGNFFGATPDGPFDVVCYWDGFGVGTDADQHRLLKRIAGWIGASGHALIDIYTPWYAAASDGHGHTFPKAQREYGFEADGCRWLDTWWARDQPETRVTQSLRCYAPADLRLLLAGTGLELVATVPGGGIDWSTGTWSTPQPLAKAMSYLAHLRPQQR